MSTSTYSSGRPTPSINSSSPSFFVDDPLTIRKPPDTRLPFFPSMLLLLLDTDRAAHTRTNHRTHLKHDDKHLGERCVGHSSMKYRQSTVTTGSPIKLEVKAVHARDPQMSPELKEGKRGSEEGFRGARRGLPSTVEFPVVLMGRLLWCRNSYGATGGAADFEYSGVALRRICEHQDSGEEHDTGDRTS